MSPSAFRSSEVTAASNAEDRKRPETNASSASASTLDALAHLRQCRADHLVLLMGDVLRVMLFKFSWTSARCFLTVVEGDADVQIKVTVAKRRRVREFIFHLGNLQAEAAAVQFDQHLQKVGSLTQDSQRERDLSGCSSPLLSVVIVRELARPRRPRPLARVRHVITQLLQRFDQNL